MVALNFEIQIPSSMIKHIHCIFDILIKIWEVFALLSSQFSTKIKPLVIPEYGELLRLYPFPARNLDFG